MELLERVFLLSDRNEASGAVVDHDGMAVIDDVEWRSLIFELDRGQSCFLRVTDVDGRLVMTILARCELWSQLTPMTRAKCVPVIPGVLRGRLLGSTTHH